MKFPWMKDDTATEYIIINNANGYVMMRDPHEGELNWERVDDVNSACRFDAVAIKQQIVPHLMTLKLPKGYSCYEVSVQYKLREVDLAVEEEKRRARAKLTPRERELLGLEDD